MAGHRGQVLIVCGEINAHLAEVDASARNIWVGIDSFLFVKNVQLNLIDIGQSNQLIDRSVVGDNVTSKI